MPWPRRISLSVALLTAVTIAAACALVPLTEVPADELFALLTPLAAGAFSGWLSLFVSHRRPANPVGPLLGLVGLAPPLLVLFDTYSYANLSRPLPGAEAVHQLAMGAWMLWYVPVLLLMLFFPTGQLPPGRFPRFVLYGVLVCMVAFMATAAVDPSPYEPPFEEYGHPLPTLPAAVIWIFMIPLLGTFMALLVCSVLVMRRRYRAGDEVERAQLKWFALGALALPGTLLLCWADYLLFGTVGILIVPGLLSLCAGVPALTALAILRHDLYDVDRATSAVVTWGLVTAGLLAIYSAASFAGGLALGQGSAVTAAAATALVAALLVPVKNRVRRWVDRHLYPVRERALAAVATLERQVHEGLGQPEQLEEVLREALAEPGVRVGFLLPGGTEFHDTAGVPVRRGTEVRLAGRPIGVIDGPCPREVAAACVLLVETVRLRLELRQALTEVEASRSRLLKTGYRERRRLERDLHDGAQSRLVSLGMALRLAQRHLGEGAVDVDGVLDQAVAELGTAVAELRELAHGLRPSSLDDGLGPALEALTLRGPVRLDWRLNGHSLPDDVATTAYFVASEAVTNAVKHAEATSIGIVVDEEDERLIVTVRDDGRGGVDPVKGSGLSGLLDRVAALGGRLQVTSTPGGGTTVEAVLPCVS
ncbi:sensor histidine kinase [Streptomyces xantholiticus]|uniref:sensor histidine kinase n=1 Tax=Streptomyces xantholiticus TaxID=68285 RepID=UPI001672BEC5|nr:ATP-binding protein [Streptomyces xantholiticus]